MKLSQGICNVRKMDGIRSLVSLYLRHHDTQHNEIQHNDTKHNGIQHNETEHNDIQHNNK